MTEPLHISYTGVLRPGVLQRWLANLRCLHCGTNAELLVTERRHISVLQHRDSRVGVCPRCGNSRVVDEISQVTIPDPNYEEPPIPPAPLGRPSKYTPRKYVRIKEVPR